MHIRKATDTVQNKKYIAVAGTDSFQQQVKCSALFFYTIIIFIKKKKKRIDF